MERRRFLSAFLAGAAALAVDPEFALWRPGAKTIFIPPTVKFGFPQPPKYLFTDARRIERQYREGKMNQFMAVPTWFTEESVKILFDQMDKNALIRLSFDQGIVQPVQVSGYRVGELLRVRKDS